MKRTSLILSAGLIAGWYATAVAQDAAQPSTTQENTPAVATQSTNTPAAPALARNPNVERTSGVADQGLTLNLRGATVDQVLSYLTESAGFAIDRQTGTSPAVTQNATGNSTVDLVSATPLNQDEIVVLLNKVLADHGLTAIKNGKLLTIESLDQAYGDPRTPININTDYTNIPQTEEIVTEVIPVHSLNPTQVIRDLFSLIPRSAQMNASETGNAVVMTARQSDIRRFAQLIKALDSTGNGDLEVFLLNYADSKSIAQELKDVFSPDSGGGAAGGNPFAGIFGRGRGGGGGGFGGGGQQAEDANKTRAAVHVNAVSDDQNNAVLVSAPIDYMDGISNIIAKLDIPQEDSIQIRYFPLHNADCTDVANELTQLFPDPNAASSQGQGNARGGRVGFVGGGFGGGRGGGGGGGGAAMSDRLKKQITVIAVPDPRTQSVLVTASKETMTEIAKIIDEMDANPAGKMMVFAYHFHRANIMEVLNPLTDLFGTQGRSSSTTTQQDPFYMRQTQAAQTQSQMQSSSTMGGGGGGGGGLGGGR